MEPPKHKIFGDTDVTVRPTRGMCTHTNRNTTIRSNANQFSTDV